MGLRTARLAFTLVAWILGLYGLYALVAVNRMPQQELQHINSRVTGLSVECSNIAKQIQDLRRKLDDLDHRTQFYKP
jgi:peptidoglycan hydrolase CwlO-like protein